MWTNYIFLKLWVNILEVRWAEISLKALDLVFDKNHQFRMVSRCHKQQSRRIFFKSAQTSDFLEPCPVWAHLPGNVNFLTQSTRYKSGLVMVKCFWWNFFWVISNCKTNDICETIWMKLWSTWEPKTMVRNTFLSARGKPERFYILLKLLLFCLTFYILSYLCLFLSFYPQVLILPHFRTL